MDFKLGLLVIWSFGLIGAHVLDEAPLIDGHNDLPNNLYLIEKNNLDNFEFAKNLTEDPKWGKQTCKSCHTDLTRLRHGKLGAQFWVAYVGCNSQYKDAVARTLEQIDVIKRLVQKYPDDLKLVTDSAGIVEAFTQGKISSLIGVEGGHSIDSKAGVLRMFYDLGARYMSLTHSCNTPWADSSEVDAPNNRPVHNLTEFGKNIVREMNRIGMMVDLSHVSRNVMNQAINVSRAPVIFSHSDAFSVRRHHRNVHNETLKLLKKNKGIIMVNFFNDYVSNNPSNATIKDVIRHINFIADIAGVDSIGIGGDYDGVSRVPRGLEDVSKYPKLFDELRLSNTKRWTGENLKKISSANFLRVFKDVEFVRDSLRNERPFQEWISDTDLLNVQEQNLVWQCHSRFGEHTNNGLALTYNLGLIVFGMLFLNLFI